MPRLLWLVSTFLLLPAATVLSDTPMRRSTSASSLTTSSSERAGAAAVRGGGDRAAAGSGDGRSVLGAPSRLLAAYNTNVELFPLTTNMLTGAGVMALGDYACQTLVEGGKVGACYDHHRTLCAAAVGVVWQGTACFLDTVAAA